MEQVLKFIFVESHYHQELFILEATKKNLPVQVNLIITLSIGSIETDRLISEPCYIEVIYYRHIAK